MNNQIIKEKVWSYKDEMLNRLDKLISIPSEMSAPTEDAPFGEQPLLALTTALDMLKAMKH